MPARGPNDALSDGDTALKTLTAAGVTSILDALGSEASAQTYSALQKAGKLTVRVHLAVRMGRVDDIALVDETVARVVRVRDRFDQPLQTAPGIRVHTVKMTLDGVIQAPAQTASLLAPYWVNVGDAVHERWQPGKNAGPPVYIEQNVLNALVVGFATAGIDAHIHAIGDGASRAALDAFAKMREVVPRDNIRPAIAHAELVDPDDYARFRTLNGVPVMSYQWSIPAPNSVTGAKNHLGPERFERMEPFDALDRAGARVVYGSDWPVDRLNYWLALKGGITRAGVGTYGEEFAGRLNKAPGLTRESALRSITLNGAWALHQDKELGSIETGKLADLIVLDRNFMTVSDDTLATNKVLLTMVGGTIVHDDGIAGPRK
jgi:predicted amidohydrolase YtcJ